MNGAKRLQFLGFRVVDRMFAVDIMGIREILRLQPLTPVPDAPEAVSGVLNVRGELVTVLDLRRVFGAEGEEAPPKDRRIVLARAKGVSFGLSVDAVREVLAVDLEDIEPAPVAQAGKGAHAVAGMFRSPVAGGEDRVVLLVHLGYFARLVKGEDADAPE